MERSLFSVLLKEDLTTLLVRYDYRKDQTILLASKDWEENFDFSSYNKDFHCDSLLIQNGKHYNDMEVRELFKKHNLSDYLEEVLDLIKQGKHFGVNYYFNKKHNIRYMGNIHSQIRGINNRSHATVSGGIRYHSFEDSELEVIMDGLNLSRAMSYKNVAMEIPYGGCKSTVHMDELDESNMDKMGFLGYAIDKIRCFTAPDMGFNPTMTDIMNEHFSIQYTGGTKGLGATGVPTALGVYLALKEACRFRYSNESLDGKKILVQGVGIVGHEMCRLMLEEDIELSVVDIKKEVIDNLLKEYPDRNIKVVELEDMLDQEVDIFVPCAVGAIIGEDIISQLKFDIIFGGANNQLKANSREEEERLSKILAENGILYQESWWHNIAGVLCGAEEYELGSKATIEELNKKIEAIVPLKTWENLNKADELKVTPTECAYLSCDGEIFKN